MSLYIVDIHGELKGDYEIIRKYEEPTTKNDLVTIHTEGLDECIRCAMCTNSMKSDRGCDGSCVVDKDMYKKVMDVIESNIVIEPTTKNDLGVDREDAVERLNALKQLIGYDKDSEIVKATQKSLDMAIKALEQEPTTKNYLSEEDILELKHRYGDEVEFVVRDMISGKGKRWE